MAPTMRPPTRHKTHLRASADRPAAEPGQAKPRVAVVYHFFAHYRSAVVRSLVEDGRAEFTFCGDLECFDDKIEPMSFAEGIRFRRLRTHPIKGSVMWQSGLLSLAASSEFDVLILLGIPKFLAMWPAAIIGRLTGKRVIFWTHGWTYRPTGPLRLVRSAFLKLADSIMTYGRWAKQIGIEHGFDPRRIHVIGNSLDLESQRRVRSSMTNEVRASTRRELFGNDTIPVIACSSRLTRTRRLDMLFEAAALLAKRGQPVNIALIGDGPEREPLERQAAELGLRVAFLGACYDEALIGRVLMASNVCVAPGKVGLTAIHALAFGVPVVSHGDHERQMPEHEAIIPGKTGALYEFGSIESLAEAIRPWLETQWVPATTQRRCEQIVERFWSPRFQVEAIMRAVFGLPADDLLLAKERTLD